MATEKITDLPTKKLAERIATSYKRFGCKTVAVKKQPNGKWSVTASGCPDDC